MKITRAFSIVAVFATVALTLGLTSVQSSDHPETAESFQPAPSATAYPVPAANEVQWRPSFDVNPDAVHDLSLPQG